MSILITGIHGFVGRNLVNDFRGRYSMNGIDILPGCPVGVDHVYQWNELESLPAAEVIIHLAGKAHDTKSNPDKEEYVDINVGLTKRIFDIFLNSNASKFIFFSSVKAVVDSVTGDELTEEVLPSPQTPYGKSKLEAEEFILNQPIPPPKLIYILRPCMIHGPGNKGNLNLLYKLVRNRLPYPLGAYENRRSFTSIQNLSWIVGNLIEQNILSGIYNMADDDPLSTNQIITMMAESLNRKEQIWHINPKIIRNLARVGDVLHLPLNSERMKKLTESYVVSNSKLKKSMGVDSMPVSAFNGMKMTLEAFKDDRGTRHKM